MQQLKRSEQLVAGDKSVARAVSSIAATAPSLLMASYREQGDEMAMFKLA